VLSAGHPCGCCDSLRLGKHDMTSRFPTPEEFASFPPPNYVDPVNQLPLAMAVLIPMTVLVIGFVSCRFYCRTVLVNTLGWDDWAMMVAAVSNTPYIPANEAQSTNVSR
jgi:hypothetical protein